MLALVVLAVFLASLALVIGGYQLFNRRRLRAVESARSMLGPDALGSKAAPQIIRDRTASEFAVLDRLLTRGTTAEALTRELVRAGVDMTPGAFLVLGLLAAAAGMLLGSVMGGGLVAALGAGLGVFAVWAWLKWKQRRRLRTFQTQLPDAIDMLVNAMKAGYSFQAAMKFIGDEVPAPLGPEFARFYDEQRLGMEIRTALLAMQERVPSLELKMFITALLIQRETGGNLAEVLGNIGHLMRERVSIQGEIETLTSESKLSARILSALPLVVFTAIYILDPAYMKQLIHIPLGRLAIGFAVLSVLAGYAIMMKIAAIDI